MEERKFSEQELVRREKLQELVDKGIDPFGQRLLHIQKKLRKLTVIRRMKN